MLCFSFFPFCFLLFLIPSPPYFSATDWQLPDSKFSQVAGIFYNVSFVVLQTGWSLYTSYSFSPFLIASRNDGSKDCRNQRVSLHTHCFPVVALTYINFLTCKPSNKCSHNDRKKSRKLRLMQKTNDYFALSMRCVSQPSLGHSQWGHTGHRQPHSTPTWICSSRTVAAHVKSLVYHFWGNPGDLNTQVTD